MFGVDEGGECRVKVGRFVFRLVSNKYVALFIPGIPGTSHSSGRSPVVLILIVILCPRPSNADFDM